jgi:phosphate:Na+ symporter
MQAGKPMVLLNLLAALALLLWGAGQVQRASRDLSPSWMDPLVRYAARGRHAAAASGLVAGLLQAPENPVRRGAQLAQLAVLSAAAAHAATLGASVGCALAVLAFASAPSSTFHVLLIGGAVAWHAKRGQRVRAAGRGLFGAGVVLLGLQILAIAVATAADAALLAALARALEQELLLASLLGVVTALLLRSVFAAVLLLAVLGASWLPPGATLALLAGIHVGSALASYSGREQEAMERRLAAGQLLTMLLAAALVLMLVAGMPPRIETFDGSDVAVANAALCGLAALVVLNLTGIVARWSKRLAPQRSPMAGSASLQHLDGIDPREPSLALSASLRQVMRLAALVGEMLEQASVAILHNDAAAIEAARDAEQEVDELYRGAKQYLAKIPQWRLGANEQQRWEELIAFLIALEQIADGIDTVLPRWEAWDAARQSVYPAAAQREFRTLHGLLVRNLQTAAGLCLERWPAQARSLLAAEETFRTLERSACKAHIRRLVDGDAASMAVSALHLDLLADLADMNARLCGFARLFLELHEAGKQATAVPMRAANSGKDPAVIAP